MSLIEFATVAPYNRTFVNPTEIFALEQETKAPDSSTVLLSDATRSIQVNESIDSVAAKLGDDFRHLTTASTSPQPVFINRRRVLHVLPHPEIQHVCFVHGLGRRIAVQGSLADVAGILA